MMRPKDHIRMRNIGWPFQKTLFVVSDLVCGSAVNSGIARDFEKGVYYRVLEATKGVITRLNDGQLKVVVAHETDEMREGERDLRAGRGVSLRLPEEVTEDHNTRLTPRLYRMFGQSLVDDTLARAARITEEIPSIPRVALSVWLAVFVRERSRSLIAYTIPMTEAMKSPPAKKSFLQQVMYVVEFYRDIPPEKLLSLVRVTARSKNL